MLATAILLLPLAHVEGWGGDYWWVWRLGMFALWFLFIVFVFWWFRRNAFWRGPSGMERARDILAERYARGEIDREEYRQRLEELR